MKIGDGTEAVWCRAADQHGSGRQGRKAIADAVKGGAKIVTAANAMRLAAVLREPTVFRM
jgi:hypothetical protein